ncbi:hypothetical protein AGMMS50212_17130 [Spirochaetia bacterium]|nr:hypothetical protein AGMMS50212_17130 [Spirochaetia bacterium]
MLAACPADIAKIAVERAVRREFRGLDFGTAEAFYAAFFSRMASILRLKPAKAGMLRNWYFSRYLPGMRRVLEKHYRAHPDTASLLTALCAAEVPVSIYSDYPETGGRMKAVGLPPDEFGIKAECLFGPENFGALKPAERPFRLIAEAMSVPVESVLVVGDRDDTDGEGARCAGMQFLLIGGKRRRRNNAICS